MNIDLTLSEACYLRAIVEIRVDGLKHRYEKYKRYSDSYDDIVSFQKKIACILGELEEIEHVYAELTKFISSAVLESNLLNEFGGQKGILKLGIGEDIELLGK